MPKVAFAAVETAPIIAGGAPSGVETRALISGNAQAIHLFLYRCGSGAVLPFTAAATDRMLYVWTGAVTAGSATLVPRSSIIIEHGAALTIAAGATGAEVLVFQDAAPGAEPLPGGHVHVLAQDRVPRVDSVNGGQVGMALHADSQCPTCRLWLHENDHELPDHETSVHSHSQNEIIFIRSGSMRLGQRLYGPGTAVAIAANTKYGFHSGPSGLSIVNFRGAPSVYTSADQSVVMDEVQLWHSCVGRPAYAEL